VKCAGDSNLRCLPDNRARSLPFPESIRRSADIIAVIYPKMLENGHRFTVHRSEVAPAKVARLAGQFSCLCLRYSREFRTSIPGSIVRQKCKFCCPAEGGTVLPFHGRDKSAPSGFHFRTSLSAWELVTSAPARGFRVVCNLRGFVHTRKIASAALRVKRIREAAALSRPFLLGSKTRL